MDDGTIVSGLICVAQPLKESTKANADTVNKGDIRNNFLIFQVLESINSSDLSGNRACIKLVNDEDENIFKYYFSKSLNDQFFNLKIHVRIFALL
jgi:hypothetical protein